MSKRVVSVSVRELVEFAFRRGNLGGDSGFVGPNRAAEGTKGHQRVQNSRPAGYEAEVAVRHKIERDGFTLKIRGRIDGILTTSDAVVLEEIKTVKGGWDGAPKPLHWAQGKVYACLYCLQHGLAEITVQLTYLRLRSEEVTEFRERFTLDQLTDFFNLATGLFLEWTENYHDWCLLRDASIKALAFPFSAYRAGQRKLAVEVYRAIEAGRNLFAEAPTGIGKTVSALFPAIKGVGEAKCEKVFYLTAKTVGQTVAEGALADMRAKGLRFRAVTITARDKICFNQGQPCDTAVCPFALGYYDRVKPAIKAALAREALTREVLEEVGREHNVCPFELSLDCSFWVEGVICDYNYLFDPSVSLKRYFAEEKQKFYFLVDEAHNLVDRAREMFSASLRKSQILQLKKELQTPLPHCARALGRINTQLVALKKRGLPIPEPGGLAPEAGPEAEPLLTSKEVPAALPTLVRAFVEEAEAWLADNEPAPFRQALLDCYFTALTFARVAEEFDHRFVTMLTPEEEDLEVRLFCLDPSNLLQRAVQKGIGAVFFSATLSPLDYFKEILGGTEEDRVLQLASPFPPEHLLALLNTAIATNFKERDGSYDAVCESILAFTAQRRGNYLVFFPSFKYLEEVARRTAALEPSATLLLQTTSMNSEARQAFLDRFSRPGGESLLAFAVMGGIFGEAIDLVGEKLIGAVIVGVGLPQLCAERDLIRDYFQEKNGRGFDYAYVFPGFNRVLQAAGRVIRSETDVGAVLLIDRRFAEGRYARLFPAWYHTRRVRSIGEIGQCTAGFWEALADRAGGVSGPPAVQIAPPPSR